MTPLNIPLMFNNITEEDRNAVISFLKKDPILTQSENVSQFEKEWSKWLGCRYSVFVNSGSSANFATLALLKELHGTGEVIVPPLTWVSDITAAIQNGFTPVFADIHPEHLGMHTEEILKKISHKTKAVFLTHVLGFNALSEKLLQELKNRNIPLIEDVSESHGATFQEKKLGTFGLLSNFSFYYAHHMSTIEGGMVCTDDESLYQMLRMIRSHGMVRESTNEALKSKWQEDNLNVHPEFLFAYMGHNFRNTEINAVIGRNQLKHLDENNEKRKSNFNLFLNNLDSKYYQTNFELKGSVNYAFTFILKYADPILCEKVITTLRNAKIEYRRGLSGGGNQLRQPYLKPYIGKEDYKKYPIVEHVHSYGFYLGNYPNLEKEKILSLCSLLNQTAIEMKAAA